MDVAPPLTTDMATVLVVCPSWVGDAVMATPVFRALRATLPSTRLVLVHRPGLEDLLRGGAWFDESCLALKGGLLGPFTSGRRLRSLNADAALLLPNSFRTALMVRVANIPVRVGYARDRRRGLLTHPVPWEPRARPTTTADDYRALGCAALGLEMIDPRTDLGVTPEEAAGAETLLEGVRRPFVVLNPGGNREDKRWPAERFARVAEHLGETRGLGVVVTGSPSERETLDHLVAAAPEAVDLSARGLTLGTLKGVLRASSLLISNDTGPRHIAAALGIPVVGLFGPTDHRWTSMPWACEHVLLAEPFLPDELVADQHKRACAIDRISAADVIAASEGLLDGRPVPGRTSPPSRPRGESTRGR